MIYFRKENVNFGSIREDAADFIQKVFGVYTRLMETIYLSLMREL